MNNPTLQKLRARITTELTCGGSGRRRFRICEQDKHSQLRGYCRYAVRCEYFKRLVETPDKLQRCGRAKRKPPNVRKKRRYVQSPLVKRTIDRPYPRVSRGTIKN